MPGAEPDRDRDGECRDRGSAVTRLAHAGCTVLQIAAITGHQPQTIYQILRRCPVLTPELADQAIERLVAWLDEQGIRV